MEIERGTHEAINGGIPLMKQRLVYISNARIIGILLVVFGHSYPLTGEIPKILDIVKNFIYCFHMPLFVFISAYLVSQTQSIEKYGPKQYIKNRFVKLFVPYLGLSVLGFFPKILMSSFINDEVELSITYFIRTILVPRENVWGHFWFIPMLFVMAVGTVLYTKFVRTNKKLGIVIWLMTFVLIFTPSITNWLGLNDIKNYLFWYLSGLFLGEMNTLTKFKSTINGMVCLVLGVLLFILCGMKAYNTFVALFMLAGILVLCMTIDMEKVWIFKVIEKYSFSIFILSWPAQAVVEVIGNRIFDLPLAVNMTMMFSCGVIIPLIIVWVVRKLKKLPFIEKIELLLGM